MTIIHVISFLVIAIAAGYLLRESLSDMLPFVWCGLILVLYVLAFTRSLNLIDIIFPMVAASLAVICVLRLKKEGIQGLVQYKGDNLLSVPFLTYCIICISLPILLSAKVVTWWDDINFWASDLKSIFYIGGFASKYANVSPEYGDYPPGIQLAKWYVMHIAGRGYSESMAFVGYYLFNLSFVMPVFNGVNIDKKAARPFVSIILAVATWLLQGTCDKFGYAGFCADLSMAFVFGGILISAFDIDAESKPSSTFYIIRRIRTILFLCVLPIIKSTGIIWTIVGMVVFIVVNLLKKKEIVPGSEQNDNVTFGIRRDILWTGLTVAVPFMVWGSWEGFCLLRRRVAQSTATMITYITTDKYGFSEYTGQFIKTFLRGFAFEPLHVDHTWIDLSALAMLVLVIVSLILLYKRGYISGRAGKFLVIFLPIVGVLYYCLIFVAHITIFGSETQYLEAYAMAASIERYGLPFMMGSILFISWLWLSGNIANEKQRSNKQHVWNVIVWLAAVIVLTDLPAAYNGLIGYRNKVEQDLSDRAVFIDESSVLFVEAVRNAFPEGNVRICRVRDGGFYHAADAYVAYEASPASVMSVSFELSQIDENVLISSISQTHASYVYFDAQEIDSGDDFDFEFDTLYRISYEDGMMVLE